MKTELILVGKTVNKHFIAGIKDYAERITHYMPFNITTIPELKNTKSLSEQQQKEREGELILKLLQPSDTVVLMDEHGQEFRSIEFAKWIERKQATARSSSLSSAVLTVSHRLSTTAPTRRFPSPR